MSRSRSCFSIVSTFLSDEPAASSMTPAAARSTPLDTPCVSCGACCAQFRVSFYWAEADDAPLGWVPVHLTRTLAPNKRVMAGTEQQPVRCVALVGQVGEHVACSIYAQRPSPCREFDWRDAQGQIDARCSQARLAVGLPALRLEPLDSLEPLRLGACQQVGQVQRSG